MNIKLDEIVQKLINFTGLSRKSIDKILNTILENENNKLEITSIFNDLKHLNKCSKCNIINFNKDCSNCEFKETKIAILVSSNLDLLNMKGKLDKLYKFFVFGEGNELIKKGKSNELISLLEFLKQNQIEELVFAFTPSIKTEVLYNLISNNLQRQQKNIAFTKIGIGIPFGGSLEYIDEITLRKAFKGRG